MRRDWRGLALRCFLPAIAWFFQITLGTNFRILDTQSFLATW
jgi:hypothetical protein